MKVAIVGGGQSELFLRERLRHQGIEIATEEEVTAARFSMQHMVDGLDELDRVIQHKMLGDVAVIPTRRPESTVRTRNTGAARIKRNAKQRRRRKG